MKIIGFTKKTGAIRASGSPIKNGKLDRVIVAPKFVACARERIVDGSLFMT
jgi:hypothetical protein